MSYFCARFEEDMFQLSEPEQHNRKSLTTEGLKVMIDKFTESHNNAMAKYRELYKVLKEAENE